MSTRASSCYLIQRVNVVSVPEGGCFSLSLLCLLRTTQLWSLGPWDPKSLAIRGLWDSARPPPHLSSQDCFSPIMCCLLTDRCINYEHLVQQICENMWKGNRRLKVSLNDDPVNAFACVCVCERRRCYRFCHLLRIFILIVVDLNRFSVTFVILSDFYFYSYQSHFFFLCRAADVRRK